MGVVSCVIAEGEKHVPGARKTRHPNGIGDADARISILLPKDIDRQLRALSASTGTSVSKIVRAWIVEKLQMDELPLTDGETEPDPAFCRAAYFSQEQLTDRGWTAGLIDTLLGEPEQTRANHFRVGLMQKYWSRTRVEEIETTVAFADRKIRKGKRGRRPSR
jgi:hypothetical protein